MRWLGLVLGFVAASVASFVLFFFLWVFVLFASGNGLTECDRGDCGPLGEWWSEHSLIVGAVIAGLALVAGFFVTRRLAGKSR